MQSGKKKLNKQEFQIYHRTFMLFQMKKEKKKSFWWNETFFSTENEVFCLMPDKLMLFLASFLIWVTLEMKSTAA